MKRHPFDPFSLLFGALFISVGVSFLAGSTLAEAWRSIWPMVAVVVGATLAAWAAVSALHEPQRAPVIAEADGRDGPDAMDGADAVERDEGLVEEHPERLDRKGG
jgi:hypothetical protein